MNFVTFSCVALAVFTNRIVSVESADERKVPGLEYQRNPDGSVSGSFGFSHAVDRPGANGAFGVSQTFSFGPKGASFGGSHSASLNGQHPGGNNFGFSQSNTLAHSIGPNGFSSSGGNAGSSHHSNPLFSSSQANANAFANQANFNNNFQPFQQQQQLQHQQLQQPQQDAFAPPQGHRRRPPSRRHRFRHHGFA